MLGKNMLSMSALSLFRNAVQFSMNIAIASFVLPGDYGLVVFTTPFVVLLAMLTDLGMTSALVRAPELSREEAGAAMGTTIVGGIGCAALMVLGAVPLQRAIAMPGLAPVMAAMAGIMVVSIAAATPRALLERDLRYTTIAGVEGGAIVVAAIVGFAAAVEGAGVWSLVLYNLVSQGGRLGGFGWLVRGRVWPNLRVRRLGGLLSFGGWVLATNLLNFLARNSDNLLIGAWLGAATVGVYGLAYQFMLAPLMAITWPTSAILLSTLRHEDPHSGRAQATVAGVLSATALVVAPAMLYLTFGLAFPAGALLSERWAAVPVIVAWLAPAGALQAIASYNGVLLMAAGRARAQFLLTVANTVVLLVTFITTLPLGLMAMVRAYAVAITLLSIAFLAMTVALTRLGVGRLAQAVLPPLLASGAGVLAVAATTGTHPASWIAWIVATCVYGVAVLGSYALFHLHVRRTLAILLPRAVDGAATPATGT